MNPIEAALAEYLGTAEGADDRDAIVMNALPLYHGWVGVFYLTVTGEFIYRDNETTPPQFRTEQDEHLQLVALVEGAARFPVLANLLPQRPVQNESCDTCGGTGRFVRRNATGWLYCTECHGVGWPGRITVPLARHELGSPEAAYVTFDDAALELERFLRAETGHSAIVIVPRADITLFSERAYVRRHSAAEAHALARREYERAFGGGEGWLFPRHALFRMARSWPTRMDRPVWRRRSV